MKRLCDALGFTQLMFIFKIYGEILVTCPLYGAMSVLSVKEFICIFFSPGVSEGVGGEANEKWLHAGDFLKVVSML